MVLRKVLQLHKTLALTLPREYGEAIGIKKGDYIEVYLKDNKTIIVKKHGIKPKGISLDD